MTMLDYYQCPYCESISRDPKDIEEGKCIYCSKKLIDQDENEVSVNLEKRESDQTFTEKTNIQCPVCKSSKHMKATKSDPFSMWCFRCKLGYIKYPSTKKTTYKKNIKGLKNLIHAMKQKDLLIFPDGESRHVSPEVKAVLEYFEDMMERILEKGGRGE